MSRVYLDHNATTPVEPAVLDAMLPYFSADFGNAASIHMTGQRARAAVETSREQVAALVGARPQEIVFTSGGTESDNHAIFGIVRNASGATKHIITTQIEHEAVLNTCQALEKEGGTAAGNRQARSGWRSTPRIGIPGWCSVTSSTACAGTPRSSHRGPRASGGTCARGREIRCGRGGRRLRPR